MVSNIIKALFFNTRYREINLYFINSFLLLYIILFPKGVAGIVILLIPFSYTIIKSNSDTLLLFSLVLGNEIFGLLFQYLKIPLPGSIISIGYFSVILLFRDKTLIISYLLDRKTLLFLLILVTMLLIFYLRGPQHGYAQIKLTNTPLSYLYYFFIFLFLFKDTKISIVHFFYLAIIMGMLFFALTLEMVDELRPYSIFLPAGVKTNMLEIEGVNNTINMSYNITFGLAIMFGYYYQNLITDKLNFLITVFVSFIFISSIGQRLNVIILVIFFICPLFLKTDNRRFFKVGLILSLVLVSIGVVFAYQNDVKFIVLLVDSIKDFEGGGKSLNRNNEWSSASHHISNNPYFGLGLGGYYTIGHTNVGEVTYPHNLILELLTEMGIIGTILFLITPLILLVGVLKKTLRFQQKYLLNPLPIFLLITSRAFMTLDLRTSISFISIIILFSIINEKKK